ncbi:MAG: hypothetical protein IJW82_02395 [Clostridia bacterium]|nr:hypothetical protein [Clostridia bacterium]
MNKTINSGKLLLEITQNGDINKVSYDGINLNQYRCNEYESSLYNIYLKVDDNFCKLIGIESNSSFAINNNQLFYKGIFNDIEYNVNYTLKDDCWFVDIILNDTKNQCKRVCLFYGLDVGLCYDNVNELYNSQYIDHRIENNQTYCILSKQNQGRPIMLESSCFQKLEGFSSDGFQFFGREYKETNIPRSIKENKLNNEVYQYEFGYIAFKTYNLDLTKQAKITFYHKVNDNYHIFPQTATNFNEIKAIYEGLNQNSEQVNFEKPKKNQINYNITLKTLDLTTKELDELFLEKSNIELDNNNQILSFFDKNDSHIVLKRKEKNQERPTAMVFVNNTFKKIKTSPMAFTSYMYGVFMSHIVLGNTDFNYLTNESKTPINVLKSQGLRIFVDLDNEYKLLAMPSAFKMNLNGAVWYYKTDNDFITISTAIDYFENKIELEINSQKPHNFIITNYINENFEINTLKDEIVFTVNGGLVKERYPNLVYKYKTINQNLKLEKSENKQIIIQKLENTLNVKCMFTSDYQEHQLEYEEIRVINDRFYKNFSNEIYDVKLYGKDEMISKINSITKWYVHNALIHYSSPHGLEQFSGAAWGTRDLLQGPLELFLTLGKFEIAREIILTVYSRQFSHNYDFPQWFMFDYYHNIQAGDSHGDIIVWSLMAVGEYLESTKDFSILEERVPCYIFQEGKFSQTKEMVISHINKQLLSIKNSFIKGTYLSCYGGGDWDDTLQPKDREKAKRMVSGWTIVLTIQALRKLINEIGNNTDFDVTFYRDICINMQKDFYKYIIKNDIPSGFILFDKDNIKYLLHPCDNISNIRYRLLPLTRGIIAELYSNEQVKKYQEIIKENLLYDDGVRLMSDAIKYKAGKNELFMRAETASNFGREIGMQYVHAHIRYCESMAKIGNNTNLYKGLNCILPINIKDNVSNSSLIQSNVYFSSSDGDFLNRYDAYENFRKLKTKEVKV